MHRKQEELPSYSAAVAMPVKDLQPIGIPSLSDAPPKYEDAISVPAERKPEITLDNPIKPDIAREFTYVGQEDNLESSNASVSSGSSSSGTESPLGCYSMTVSEGSSVENITKDILTGRFQTISYDEVGPHGKPQTIIQFGRQKFTPEGSRVIKGYKSPIFSFKMKGKDKDLVIRMPIRTPGTKKITRIVFGFAVIIILVFLSIAALTKAPVALGVTV
ncbi:hypothetical protein NERG_01184 [Nematocida ausubeli]|uniref:Uncharacterized protein n=1 Tax=Nematocida ausubeli (strain ATCC PRA-371 / ERTm2) TaxID=1913371 RepID=H8ZBU1_NEMA1|nr:hypothetical protein NERG_01184 [Nematocida ausubeli]